MRIFDLVGQFMVLLLLFCSQGVPPLPQYLHIKITVIQRATFKSGFCDNLQSCSQNFSKFLGCLDGQNKGEKTTSLLSHIEQKVINEYFRVKSSRRLSEQIPGR